MHISNKSSNFAPLCNDTPLFVPMQSEPTEGAAERGCTMHPIAPDNPDGGQTMNQATTNNGQPTAAAFYMITAEQLREVAERAAAAVAAKYESERTDRLCTTKQAAEILQVDKTTLWRWSNCGILHPLQIGRQNMYKYSELMQQGGRVCE